MASEHVERKLAAILAADVAGYSRLTGADEERTLARLRALRGDLIDPAVAAHHGRVVKRTGDGALIEFRSVVDAVRCAVEVQNGMAERNAGLPPERRIEFRVGIHLGDVVEEIDGDLMGDGVNIAARLEGIAKPGGICLSEDAYRQVKSRLDWTVSDLGEQRLKNIAEPVRVFAVDPGPSRADVRTGARGRTGSRPAVVAAIALALAAAAGGAWYWRGTAPSPSAPPSSIVVLPFINLSRDPAQQYLGDAITEAVTTRLARIPGMFVIARTTAFTYKGKPVDVKQIGKELGVHYVVEGSEQHSDEKLRVNAQLIDAETGAHVWADQFEAQRSDPLQMQDEIVTGIVRAAALPFAAAAAARVERTRPSSLEAADLAVRCVAAACAWEGSPAAWQTATSLCEQALQADDRNDFAMSTVSLKYSIRVVSAQSSDPKGDLQKADELASRALALDPNDGHAHFAKSYVLLGQKRTEEAIFEGERSLALNPSNIDAYFPLCAGNNLLGHPDRALELADKAIRLSPHDPFLPALYHMKGWAYFMKRQYDQAIEWLRRAMPVGGGPFTELLLASALALTGQQAEAHQTFESYLTFPGVTTKTIAQLREQQLSLADNPVWVEYNERLFDGLRKAGMPEK
jgi:adenylate cyclase